MRRTHLRGHPNILKRLLIHVCGLNLGILLRALCGFGTPRGLQDGDTPRFQQSEIGILLLLSLIQQVKQPKMSRVERIGNPGLSRNALSSTLRFSSLTCRHQNCSSSTPGC